MNPRLHSQERGFAEGVFRGSPCFCFLIHDVGGKSSSFCFAPSQPCSSSFQIVIYVFGHLVSARVALSQVVETTCCAIDTLSQVDTLLGLPAVGMRYRRNVRYLQILLAMD